MKKSLFIILFIIIAIPFYCSLNNGLNFKINEFYLKIKWSWNEGSTADFNTYSFLKTIYLINYNYDSLKNIKEHYEVVSRFDKKENKYKIELYKLYNEVDKSLLLYKDKLSKNTDVINSIYNMLISKLNLKKNKTESCNLYIAFVPNTYLDPDYKERNKINDFLSDTELDFANMGIQSNWQGYIYSIYFKKESMFDSLKKIDPQIVIINSIDLYDKTLNFLDITLYK